MTGADSNVDIPLWKWAGWQALAEETSMGVIVSQALRAKRARIEAEQADKKKPEQE